MKKARPWILWLVLFPSVACANDNPGRNITEPDAVERRNPAFTISAETTRITGPRMRDGRVDYWAAIDQRMREGLTAENNAAVLIVEALGPNIALRDLGAETLEQLGTQLPLDEEEHFIGFLEFLQKHNVQLGRPESIERLSPLITAPWKQGDDQLAYEWLARNEDALHLITAASQRPRLHFPSARETSEFLPEAALASTQVPYHHLMSVPRALALRAMLRLGADDVLGARADAMTIHRLARLVGQMPLLLSAYWACILESTAYEVDIRIANYDHLTVTQARIARHAIEDLLAVCDVVEAVDIGQRYAFLDFTQSLAMGGMDKVAIISVIPVNRFWELCLSCVPARAVINFDVPLRRGNETFDALVAALREPDPQRRAAMVAEIDKRVYMPEGDPTLKLMADWLFSGTLREHLGEYAFRLLYACLEGPVRHIDRRHMRAMALRDLARLAFALAAYRADHQAYPASLDKLVPDYIPKLPIDVFSQEDLHYSASGDSYLLYSVGPNRLDDEGHDPDSEPQGDDIIARKQ